MSEKKGIELIKKAMTVAATVKKDVTAALEDKKISLLEALGLLGTLTTAQEVFANGDELIAEIEDKSEAEDVELHDHALSLDVAEEDKEEFIADATILVLSAAKMFMTVKKLAQGKQAVN